MFCLRFLVCVCLTLVSLWPVSCHLCLLALCVCLWILSPVPVCVPLLVFHSMSLLFVMCINVCSPQPVMSLLSPSLHVSSPLTFSMFPCLFVSPPYVSPDCLVPTYVPSFWPWCLSLCFISCFILTVYRPVFSVFSFAFPISYAYSFQLCSHVFPLSLSCLSVYIVSVSLSPVSPCFHGISKYLTVFSFPSSGFSWLVLRLIWFPCFVHVCYQPQ